MAHHYSNILHSHNQEYHPLDNLPPTYPSTVPIQADAPCALRDVNYDATSYFGHDITDYRNNHSIPISTESAPTARYSSGSSIQKLHPTEVVTNPLGNRPQFSVRDWQWELGASLFSMGCFAAVVGVLAANDTKSLARWTFIFGTSLNTLIAVLSTLSRTALMVPVASCISQLKWIHLVGSSRPLRDVQIFEDASRGPWGSFELIRRLHINSKLATWGSLITILTLAMGPFAQQLLSYPSRDVISGEAMFHTSHIYDSAYGEFRSLRAATGRITATMGPNMQGAIINGLFNLSSPYQFACTTGNCQWDEFSSLAVASSCQNVTSGTKVLCAQKGSGMYCNYTTPAGFVIGASQHQSSGGGSSTYFNSTAFKPIAYGKGAIGDRDSPVNSTLLKFAMADMQGWRNLSTPDFLECNMRLCARVTRNLTIINGIFNPGISEDIELDGVPGRYEENLKEQIQTQRDWYTFNISGDHPSYPGNRSFSYNFIDLEGAQTFLYNIFTSRYDTAGPGSDSSSGSLYYWPLMNSTDKAGTVASISESMSYAFAQAPSREELKGSALSSELYIKVHWPWIALPLAEVIMSIAFLVCTLIHTQRKGITVWKSSGIVPLLTVMVGWESNDLGAASGRDIEERSKNMRGRLVANDGDVQGFHRTD